MTEHSSIIMMMRMVLVLVLVSVSVSVSVLVLVLVLEDWETKVEYSLRFEQISLEYRPELSKQQLLSRSFTESFYKTFPVEA